MSMNPKDIHPEAHLGLACGTSRCPTELVQSARSAGQPRICFGTMLSGPTARSRCWRKRGPRCKLRRKSDVLLTNVMWFIHRGSRPRHALGCLTPSNACTGGGQPSGSRSAWPRNRGYHERKYRAREARPLRSREKRFVFPFRAWTLKAKLSENLDYAWNIPT